MKTGILKTLSKLLIVCSISAALGFFVAFILYEIPIGGGGFDLDSPDREKELLIMGFDKGILGKHQVTIMQENKETLKVEPIFTYLHHAGGLYLRGQENRSVEWSDDSKSVKVTYEDKIYGEKVIMSFEYNFDSQEWVLKKTRLVGGEE